MIASVSAALGVLKGVAAKPGIGLSELARSLGMQKSRTFRILDTLVAEGFVVQDADKGYHLGMQAMILGHSARRGTGIISKAEGLIERLAEKFDENIQIRVRDGLVSVQIYARKSHQRLRVESSAGNRRPLGLGASGRLLLAHTPPEEIKDSEYTGRPMSAKEREEILRRGFTDSAGELTEGIEAVAVPIFGSDGRCHVCLSASVPSARMNPVYKTALISGLQEVASALSYHSSTKRKGEP